jgi:SAM-dependent methyltransferase
MADRQILRNGYLRPMDRDHIRANRESWAEEAKNYVESGRRHWGSEEPSWGVFNVPESKVRLLPEVDGQDVLEAGCGTAYVSAWIARRGGRPVGLDPTAEQLATAVRFQKDFDLNFPLVMAAAEDMPFAEKSFDIVISEYGAAIWADPYRWIPEAARVLRPGGELVFLGNGNLAMLCAPDDENDPISETLLRDYFGMHRFEWPDDPSIEFHLGYGDWIRLLRKNDFEVEDLIELRPAEDATTRHSWASVEWARRWPIEEVWKARKRS